MAKWAKKIDGLDKFRCERQVDFEGEKHDFRDALDRHGLGHFMKPVGKYREGVIREFYSSMIVDSKAGVITSKVGGKKVVVTPELIARYLDYKRPAKAKVTYPSASRKLSLSTIRETIGEEEGAYDEKGRVFIPSRLGEAYRLANKFAYFDLAPFSNEKRPSATDGALLYVLGSETEVVDWAEYVWDQLRFFREKERGPIVFIFPVLITIFCERAGVDVSEDPPIVGRPGPITMASIRKSRTLSARISSHTSIPSRTPRQAEEEEAEEEDREESGLRQILERIERRQREDRRVSKWIVETLESKFDVAYSGDRRDFEATDDEGDKAGDEGSGSGSGSGSSESGTGSGSGSGTEESGSAKSGSAKSGSAKSGSEESGDEETGDGDDAGE